MRLPSTDVRIHPEPSIATSPLTHDRRPTCTICHVQSSPYTCPTCNIPYCSLACFKNEKRHGGCLGAFQKRGEKEVRESVKGEAPDEGEREKVMEMLRRWQLEGGRELDWEAILGGEGEEGSDEEGSDEGEAGKPAITEADLPEQEADLLALLDEDQRKVFLDAIKSDDDGRSTSRAQQLWDKLYASDQPSSQPWWMQEDPLTPRHDASFHSSVQALASSRRASGTWQTGVSWNLVAVLLAYTYILQHLDVSSLDELRADEASRRLAQDLFTQLTPHLTSARSTILLGSASEVTLYILDNLGEEHRSDSPSELMLYLYKQIKKLCSASRRMVKTDDDDDAMLLALQDIWSFFATQQATARKAVFYAAHYIHGSSTANPFHDVVLGNAAPSSAILDDISQQVGHEHPPPISKRSPSTTIESEIAHLQQEVEEAHRQDRVAATLAWQAGASGRPATATATHPESPTASTVRSSRNVIPSRISSTSTPLIQPLLSASASAVKGPPAMPEVAAASSQPPVPQPPQPPSAPPPRFKSFKAARDKRRGRGEFKLDRPGSVVREGEREDA